MKENIGKYFLVGGVVVGIFGALLYSSLQRDQPESVNDTKTQTETQVKTVTAPETADEATGTSVTATEITTEEAQENSEPTAVVEATETLPEAVEVEEAATQQTTNAVESETAITPDPVEPVASTEPASQVEQPESQNTTSDNPATDVTDQSQTEMSLEGDKPEFDVVRVDDTGTAVIAGTAEPNSTVTILSDGEKIGEAVAGSSGEFVAIVQTPAKDSGQAIELESEIDGQIVFSDESIIILPTLNSSAAEGVAAESAPSIIRASNDEVVIIQSGGQLFLDQISLDSISYDEEGEVVLAGRGNPGNRVIVYVNDASDAETIISESGSWKTVLQDLRAGRYVLRVDEIDADGTVNSRAESPFQRAFPQEVREAQERGQGTYIVQPGNSLWIIATGKYGEGGKYHQILTANQDQIRDPDLIYPGQVFDIPEAAE